MTNIETMERRPNRRSVRPVTWFAIAGAVAIVLSAVLVLGRGKSQPKGQPVSVDTPHVEGRAIVMPRSFVKTAGIKMARVVSGTLTPLVRVVGTVTFDPEHVAAIGTRVRGFVRIAKKTEGDHVKEGDVLAEIESAELGEAQAELLSAKARRSAAELNAARESELASQRLTTKREAEVAHATLAEQEAAYTAAAQRATAYGAKTSGQFGVYALRSPIAGTVVERHVSLGQSVEPNLVAYRVANLRHLWIELAVFERDITAVRLGDSVEIRPLGQPDESITGRVAHVGEVIDLATRSADVRVEVDNSRGKLRPGQSVVARIHSASEGIHGVIIPAKAVTYIDGKPTVFVAESERRMFPTTVSLGPADETRLVVVAGLEEGQYVVVEGVFALKSELFR